MIDDVGQLFFLIFNRVAQTVHLDLERWGCFAFFLLLAFDRLVFLALKTFLTLVEIFKSAVNRKDLIHKIGSINNQLSRLLCYTLDSLVDVPILQQHFLVVRFDLLVVPISDEFCHMDENLVLLPCWFVLEGPFVVAQIRYVRVVFSIVPSMVFLVFSFLYAGRTFARLRLNPSA